MEVRLDSISNPCFVVLESECEREAYDLGAIGSLLAAHGKKINVEQDGDHVALSVYVEDVKEA